LLGDGERQEAGPGWRKWVTGKWISGLGDCEGITVRTYHINSVVIVLLRPRETGDAGCWRAVGGGLASGVAKVFQEGLLWI
jgi:hypothetical protein